MPAFIANLKRALQVGTLLLMPGERTPLLSNEAGPSTLPLASRRWLLDVEAAEVLRRLRSSPSSGAVTGNERVPENARLAVLLYALNELSYAHVPPGPIRKRIKKARMDVAIQEVLLEEVERLLDGEQQDLEDESASGWMSETDTSGEMLWAPWERKDGTWISAMELLLPPQAKSSSPFLSHPVVRYQLEQVWRHGVRFEEASGWLDELRNQITPRRMHLLHLASLLTWVGLALGIGISPGAWISPYHNDENLRPRPNALEIVWIIWTIDIMRNLSLVPSILALPLFLSLLTLPSPSTTYSLIAASIPLLTIMLIIPTYPSIPLLAPSSAMMPLSTLLLSTLNRSLRPLGILLPFLILALALFSWAINGDPFRAFLALTSRPNEPTIPENPVEDGVAPFQIRLSLFITFCMLLFIAVTLGFARSALPQPASAFRGREARRWEGDVMSEDDWEKDYGVVIGRRARKRFGEAVLAGLGKDWRWTAAHLRTHQPAESLGTGVGDGTGISLSAEGRIDILCPLDLLVLPLDVLHLASQLLRRLSGEQEVTALERGLWRIRQATAKILMGPLCFALSSIGL